MKICIHQTHHSVADFKSIFDYLEKQLNQNSADTLHIYPELFLTGYPLQDICLEKSFIDAYCNFLSRVEKLAQTLPKADTCHLMGGLQYIFNSDSHTIPERIENVMYQLTPGEPLRVVHTKNLLPNYDIFDEKKYFTAGTTPNVIEWNHKKLGLLICEDMWFSNVHKINPVEDLKNLNMDLDLVINLSASPYCLTKPEKRLARAKEISHLLKAPFIYVNRVGCEDEIIFDGNSFAVDSDEVLFQMKAFESEQKTVELSKNKNTKYRNVTEAADNTWESLFSPLIDFNHKPLPIIKQLTDSDCQEMIDALCFGFQEYASKSGFKNFTIALSGGMDSALVLALIKISLKAEQTVEAIYMPSQFSRNISWQASEEMCLKNKIPLYNLAIHETHDLCRKTMKTVMDKELAGLADENIQSRLRGMYLYARSNQINSLVVNTSNKSELSVGYSTIYGDSVGAISMLGDVYKSEVYQLARYINKKYDGMIPIEIIERPPSAELREDQKDEDSLPPYDRMDTMLDGILSYRYSPAQLIELGFDSEEVHRVVNLYRKSEYKRRQFCPIIKVKSKSFGFGYRVPITRNSNYYLS